MLIAIECKHPTETRKTNYKWTHLNDEDGQVHLLERVIYFFFFDNATSISVLQVSAFTEDNDIFHPVCPRDYQRVQLCCCGMWYEWKFGS